MLAPVTPQRSASGPQSSVLTATPSAEASTTRDECEESVLDSADEAEQTICI